MDRLTFDMPFAKMLSALPVRAYSTSVSADALTVIWRRRYLILALMALSLLAGVATLWALPGKYTAEAIIQLDLSKREGVIGSDQTAAVVLDGSAIVQGEARLIRLRPIVRAVVEKLGLAEDPAYGADVAAPANRMFGMLHSAIATLAFGGSKEASQARSADEDGNRAGRAIDYVSKRLVVSTENRTYLINIAYSSEDPAAAARIANAFAEEYLQRRMQASADAASRMNEWLQAQLRTAAANLSEAEAEIAIFREKTGLLEPGRLEAGGDAENIMQQQLRSVATQLSAASVARLNEERKLARVQELVTGGNVPSTTDLQGLPLIASLLGREAMARHELGELLSRFGSQHPEVQRARAGITDLRTQIKDEIRRSVSVISGDLTAARRLEDELQGRLNTVQRTMIASKRNEAELRDLQAKAQAIRDRITSLTRRSDQAAAAFDLRPVVASLAMPAEPARLPSSPKPTVILGIALLGGLFVGVGLAMVTERRDHGLRTPADVKAGYDVPCLGMVPELAANGVKSAAAQRRRAFFDEAIYSVCAGANLLDTVDGCKIVLATSSVPGEGISTFCRAMASALAASGRRVLLVSGASKQATLRPLCDAPPAVSEMASGKRGGELMADSASQGKFVVLERTRSFPLIVDMFGAGGLENRLKEARKHFDVILVEGEPVMLVADSFILGRVADSVIHVVRWAHTKQRVVDAALHRLQEQSVSVSGVVLTRVDLPRHARLHLMDECSFFTRERRFYERLAKRRGQISAMSVNAA